MREVITNNLDETFEFAKDFFKSITPPCIITLNGDLGAGKTAFTKALAKAMGINTIVTSPTFTLMNEYDEGVFPLYHFDMYRIENAEDVYELGFYDYFNSPNAVIVCEWPNVINDILPKIGFDITIQKLGETSRKFIIKER
ncbi:MAG: tRNA (adenosine(37)-N6)-threonylcarbamoyltransferase complex ATPase subunit type 1 TsaE [Clostridia bacterium]|nr:tRNA (adenosine(37)-N6)-threonylcarbamoyltransferase complex ATPase subunit type 1 TsaE [Clostridia bacterium]